jgi:hypothetical protein
MKLFIVENVCCDVLVVGFLHSDLTVSLYIPII